MDDFKEKTKITSKILSFNILGKFLESSVQKKMSIEASKYMEGNLI